MNSDSAKRLGNYSGQLALGNRPDNVYPDGVYYTLPWDSILNWNIKDFGPLYIPSKGDRISLERKNALIYKKIIEWEKGYFLSLENDTLRDNEIILSDYTFSHNYYFMGGGKVENSQDSRYWGLLPEDLIVGQASLVWKSIDPYTGKFRWKRTLKRIK